MLVIRLLGQSHGPCGELGDQIETLKERAFTSDHIVLSQPRARFYCCLPWPPLVALADKTRHLMGIL